MEWRPARLIAGVPRARAGSWGAPRRGSAGSGERSLAASSVRWGGGGRPQAAETPSFSSAAALPRVLALAFKAHKNILFVTLQQCFYQQFLFSFFSPNVLKLRKSFKSQET